MQSSSTLMRISGLISEVKKSPLINDYENIVYTEDRAQAKRDVGKKVWFIPNTFVRGLRISTIPGKLDYYYYSHLNSIRDRQQKTYRFLSRLCLLRGVGVKRNLLKLVNFQTKVCCFKLLLEGKLAVTETVNNLLESFEKQMT